MTKIDQICSAYINMNWLRPEKAVWLTVAHQLISEKLLKATRFWKLINRGRAESVMWHMNMIDFEKKLKKTVWELRVAEYKRFLSKTNLQVWDIGLRPLSPHLIKMANSLTKEKRLEVKLEWCNSCEPFIYELLNEELSKGSKAGGYNFVVLEKI